MSIECWSWTFVIPLASSNALYHRSLQAFINSSIKESFRGSEKSCVADLSQPLLPVHLSYFSFTPLSYLLLPPSFSL